MVRSYSERSQWTDLEQVVCIRWACALLYGMFTVVLYIHVLYLHAVHYLELTVSAPLPVHACWLNSHEAGPIVLDWFVGSKTRKTSSVSSKTALIYSVLTKAEQNRCNCRRRHRNHHMPPDIACHVPLHQVSVFHLEATSSSRCASRISLMFIFAFPHKWMQLCAITGWWVPEHSPATHLKNTPTHKKHVCTHDSRLSNANIPGCAAVTIRPGQRHKGARTGFSLLPLSSLRSRRTACRREISSWTWKDTRTVRYEDESDGKMTRTWVVQGFCVWEKHLK